MKNYKSQGVVLHTVKYGDTSLVVYMLTKSMGRQTYLVQGVRSSRGKGNKAALFQPMFVLDYEGIETPHSQMHRLKDTRSLFPMSTIPFDIRKSTISLFMAETLYRLIREIEPNSSLFDFVCNSVQALDAMESGIANFHLWFLVKLSYFLGFYPANEYRLDSWFDIKEGCFVESLPDHRMVLSQHESRILHEMMRVDFADLHSVELTRSSRSEFLSSILNYFGYHFDAVHNIQSINILREVF